MRIIIGILSVFIWQSMMAIDANNAFQKGNKYFEAQEYGKAIEAYDSLLMLDYRSCYNCIIILQMHIIKQISLERRSCILKEGLGYLLAIKI